MVNRIKSLPTYTLPAVEVKDKNGKPISIGDLAYADGCEGGGVIVAIALDHVVLERCDEDGDIHRFSDYSHNFVTGGRSSLTGKLAVTGKLAGVDDK